MQYNLLQIVCAWAHTFHVSSCYHAIPRMCHTLFKNILFRSTWNVVYMNLSHPRDQTVVGMCNSRQYSKQFWLFSTQIFILWLLCVTKACYKYRFWLMVSSAVSFVRSSGTLFDRCYKHKQLQINVGKVTTML